MGANELPLKVNDKQRYNIEAQLCTFETGPMHGSHFMPVLVLEIDVELASAQILLQRVIVGHSSRLVQLQTRHLPTSGHWK